MKLRILKRCKILEILQLQVLGRHNKFLHHGKGLAEGCVQRQRIGDRSLILHKIHSLIDARSTNNSPTPNFSRLLVDGSGSIVVVSNHFFDKGQLQLNAHNYQEVVK